MSLESSRRLLAEVGMTGSRSAREILDLYESLKCCWSRRIFEPRCREIILIWHESAAPGSRFHEPIDAPWPWLAVLGFGWSSVQETRIRKAQSACKAKIGCYCAQQGWASLWWSTALAMSRDTVASGLRSLYALIKHHAHVLRARPKQRQMLSMILAVCEVLRGCTAGSVKKQPSGDAGTLRRGRSCNPANRTNASFSQGLLELRGRRPGPNIGHPGRRSREQLLWLPWLFLRGRRGHLEPNRHAVGRCLC